MCQIHILLDELRPDPWGITSFGPSTDDFFNVLNDFFNVLNDFFNVLNDLFNVLNDGALKTFSLLSFRSFIFNVSLQNLP